MNRQLKNPCIEPIVQEFGRREQGLYSIVERGEMRGNDGGWYSAIGGYPTGVSPTGEIRRYFVRKTNQGTTVGKRFSTAQEALEDLDSNLQRRKAELRSELLKMTTSELASQAEYWLKESISGEK